MGATYFATYAAIAALVVLVCQLLGKWFNVSGQAKQYMSWGIAIVVTAIAVVLGIFVDFGAFAGFDTSSWYDWIQAIAVAIGCGLVSNGLYDWDVIQAFLEKLGLMKSDTESKK